VISVGDSKAQWDVPRIRVFFRGKRIFEVNRPIALEALQPPGLAALTIN